MRPSSTRDLSLETAESRYLLVDSIPQWHAIDAESQRIWLNHARRAVAGLRLFLDDDAFFLQYTDCYRAALVLKIDGTYTPVALIWLFRK
jgi:hypothetical protein